MAVNYPNDANIIERTASQLRTSDMSFSGYGGGSYLKTNFSAIKNAGYADYILIVDDKNDGTAGGTATSGSFQQRDLISIFSDNDNHATLAANVVTLDSGLYEFKIFATTGAGVGVHQACLWDVEGGEVLVLGQTSNDGNVAIVDGYIDTETEIDVDIRHRVTTTVTTTGWGAACSFGEYEVYTIFHLYKIS